MTDSRLATLIRQLQGMISDLQDALSGKSFRSGSVVVHTAASATGSTTVAHGLGKVPAEAFATAKGTAGLINAEIDSFDATNVVVRVGYTDGTARTQDNTVYWLVAG